MYHLSDYQYPLPEERIAQQPCKNRSRSRLLAVDRASGRVFHHRFEDIVQILDENDVLVYNDTKVVPARLPGKKESGGKIEVLIIDYAQGMQQLEKTGCFECDCLVKASISPKPGALLYFEGGVSARVESRKEGITRIRFLNGRDFLSFLESHGKIPLPPYIKRDDDSLSAKDKEDYQTVYARYEGAVAAPTAGLHFTQPLMNKLKQKGVGFIPITLHVGYGTFVPVKAADIRDHKIHSEYVSLPEASAQRINEAKKAGKRIVAVGTTSVRTLEYLSDDNGLVSACSGACDLYIYPEYRFKCVDAMITNFHLPGSSLLMLISAFYDRKKILQIYEQAIAEKYRFFSYGDAMLIE